MSTGDLPTGPDWELGPGWQGVTTYNGGSAEYYYLIKRQRKQRKRGI